MIPNFHINFIIFDLPTILFVIAIVFITALAEWPLKYLISYSLHLFAYLLQYFIPISISHIVESLRFIIAVF